MELLIFLLIYVVGGYFATGLTMYGYLVVKSYESLGFWDFSITDGYVGVFPYPRYLLIWLYWISKLFK